MADDASTIGIGLEGATLGGRYRVDSLLGRGGMASVHLATDLKLELRRVVVKVPHPELARDPHYRRRFVGEVRSLARLEHPSVVPIYDSGEHAGLPYAVVRYLEGGSLGARLRSETQAPEQVMAWLPTIAAALDQIHARGYLHRDIKPDNILFDADGNVYVSDLGIAIRLDAGTATDPGTRLTETHALIGAPEYMPPESRDRILTPHYDQYSLGVVVFEALAGRRPFETSRAQGPRDPRHGGSRRLRHVAKGVPRGVERAVLRTLAPHPQERYASCREFAEAFQRGLGAGRGPWPIAAVAAAAVVFALAAWVWRGEPEDPLVQTGGDRASVGPRLFTMGSTEREIEDALALCRRYEDSCERAWYESEALREVRLLPSALDVHEVTNQDFADFVRATGHRTTAEATGYSYAGLVRVDGASWRTPLGPDSIWSDRPRHPVVHVSARDAAAYCAYRGQRLPTEAEWEYAARGMERRVFPWGAKWDGERAAWREQEASELAPVGSRPSGATPEGLQDLAGSVWEWTAAETPGDSPLKGGSWLERNPSNLRSAAHLAESPEYTSDDVGFRCARVLAAPSAEGAE